MFETHFGLKKRPFRALATGNDVFVGPQTAATVAGIKKALSASDAIVAIYGPVGSGKTTLVGRALEGVSDKLVAVPVGRIKLAHDEVLELLLEEMGVENIPAGTVQRFTRFRRKIQELTSEGARVVIVVEDAAYMGVHGLSELEALTAADAGVSEGAAVLITGGPETPDLLNSPKLARLRQRLRWSKPIEPLNEKELRGYFAHCFRAVGGEFTTVFPGDALPLLHSMSDGIPRVANKLVEAAMAAAAERQEDSVSADLIREVAKTQFELEADVTPVPAAEPEVTAPAASATSVEPADDLDILPPDAQPATTPRASEPVEAGSVKDDEDEEIPELIQDTLPDLEVLAPQLASRAADEQIPDWERDPTLAQLRPDLEALEHAMAVAQGTDTDSDVDDSAEPPVLKPMSEKPQVVPEITLDKQIQAKIEEDVEAIKKAEEDAAAKAKSDKEAVETIDIADTGEINIQDLPPLPNETAAAPEPKPTAAAPEPVPAAQTAAPEPVPTPEPEPESGNSDSDILKIAQNLSRAKTIDDVDDKMAETLFGEEFSEIAAQVAAKAATELPANDDLEPAGNEPLEKPAPTASIDGAAAVSVTPSVTPPPAAPAMDNSASERLATVRALNGTPNVAPPLPPSAESIVMTENTVGSQPSASNGHPESIEDQFTSMTQTMKALKIEPAKFDDDEEEEKKGFFSRFRK